MVMFGPWMPASSASKAFQVLSEALASLAAMLSPLTFAERRLSLTAKRLGHRSLDRDEPLLQETLFAKRFTVSLEVRGGAQAQWSGAFEREVLSADAAQQAFAGALTRATSNELRWIELVRANAMTSLTPRELETYEDQLEVLRDKGLSFVEDPAHVELKFARIRSHGGGLTEGTHAFALFGRDRAGVTTAFVWNQSYDVYVPRRSRDARPLE